MRFLLIPKLGPEISDLLVSYDPETLRRLPVLKEAVVGRFLSIGNRAAVRIVRRIAERDGVLDPEAVDRLLIKAHCEMQRISEEFRHGERVAEFLQPLVEAIRRRATRSPIRVTDIGCGMGFVVRWLAAYGGFPDDVELTGVDYNAALVEEARRLAGAEGLRCSFSVANAFNLEPPASIYLSTGFIHHLPAETLARFFSEHDKAETCAFAHFDFQATPFAAFGSWLFHAVRMREPLARHDGVLSAMRVHGASHLLSAARRGAPGFAVGMFSSKLWRLPIPRVFHAVVGVREEHRDNFVAALGSRASRMRFE